MRHVRGGEDCAWQREKLPLNLEMVMRFSSGAWWKVKANRCLHLFHGGDTSSMISRWRWGAQQGTSRNGRSSVGEETLNMRPCMHNSEVPLSRQSSWYSVQMQSCHSKLVDTVSRSTVPIEYKPVLSEDWCVQTHTRHGGKCHARKYHAGSERAGADHKRVGTLVVQTKSCCLSTKIRQYHRVSCKWHKHVCSVVLPRIPCGGPRWHRKPNLCGCF